MITARSRFLRSFVVALGAGLIVATTPGAASASMAHPSVVSADPANFTPNVIDDAAVSNAVVYALEQSGSTMYAGGRFRTVRNSGSATNITRFNMMSFSATNGAVTSFAPNFNGAVWAIRASGTSLYVGGDFTTVNGVARPGLVRINATTGVVDQTFKPTSISSRVSEIRLVNGRLIVGGRFAKKLAALDPATGADTGYLNLSISGSVATNAGAPEVYRFAVNSAQSHLVAIGNFTTVAGQTRYRAFMLNLGSPASLNAWYYQPLKKLCKATSIPEYLRDVDFSPDGSYFVLVSTGHIPATTAGIGTDVCDAAARFETAVLAPVKPTWINYTGGDTLHSVAVTGAAVYVQGHQRWLDNPYGNDFPDATAVSRPGIGAIHPTTGKALAWNPTKSREVGGRDFLVTSAGLWVASDGRYFAGEQRWGIAFCPV